MADIREIWSQLKGWQKGAIIGLIISLVSLIPIVFIGTANIIASLCIIILGPDGYFDNIALLNFTSILIYAIFGWLLWDLEKKTTAWVWLILNIVIGGYIIFAAVFMY
jgi:hypothetical protein